LAAATAGDTAAVRAVDAAARALGRLLAWVTGATGAGTVVVSGEGSGLLDVAGDTVRTACAADRHPDADPVRLLVEPPDFVMWARGAAAVAIQDVLVGAP
ncbi:MarR family transcriptional regulator, partial [Cellulomonas triticagri]